MLHLMRHIVLVIGTALPLSASFAHEFWIEPERYQVAPGDPIIARFRNGEKFEGVDLPYLDRQSVRLEMVRGQDVATFTPRNGDRPVIDQPNLGPGLTVLAHETAPRTLTYRDWESFAAFAAHKDFPDIAARQDARGLPREDFKERYTRHAKALVAVGDGAGSDRALGLETEFVALDNPYAAGFDGVMEVALRYQGEPRPDAQVEVFDAAPDGSVTVTLTRTDAEGRAAVPVMPGHRYLFDAVVLRPVEPAEAGDPVWETVWAALTFAVPD
jgi:cobalt/nickel transport protein